MNSPRLTRSALALAGLLASGSALATSGGTEPTALAAQPARGRDPDLAERLLAATC